MRFLQLDHISVLEPGKKIEAVKTLTGNEDYLRDHFPRFAVMPGVLMVEALFQASSLLVRSTGNFKAGLVYLRSAKNLKFADFVQPGQTLRIECEILKQDGEDFTVKVLGSKEGKSAVSGRLVIRAIERDPAPPEDLRSAKYARELTDRLLQSAMV